MSDGALIVGRDDEIAHCRCARPQHRVDGAGDYVYPAPSRINLNLTQSAPEAAVHGDARDRLM
jgi:hypothetical protein